MTNSSGCSSREIALTPAEFSDVIAPREEGLDIARRLAQPLTVLDESNADETLAIFPKTDPRRNRHIGPLEQELRESKAPPYPKGWRKRRPNEHSCTGRWHFPASSPKTIDQDVAAGAIPLAGLGNAILGSVERRGRC